jgi:hypothetical protein
MQKLERAFVVEEIIEKSSMKADPVIVICALVIKAKQCVRALAPAFVAEKFIPKSSIKADPVIVI